MQVLFAKCAGLDVHKATVVACTIITSKDGKATKEIKTFGTNVGDLLKLGDWLRQKEVTHVAMESTGSYWKPVYNILEGQAELLVVNAQHIKAVPGRKTDVKDSEWIADLLRHGLMRGSFIPAKPQRELRELVRHRSNVVARRAQAVNEVHRTLESTNIKLGNVATDITGVSATEMLTAILAGQTDPLLLAKMARGRMKEKHAALEAALQGRVEEHHRLILSQLMAEIAAFDEQIIEASGVIAKRMQGDQELLDRLDEIPGVNQRIAQVIAAEVGTEVKRFPSANHLISWAGMCPGNNESAGKRHKSKVKPGNRSLKQALTEAANGAAKTRNCYLSALHRRLVARRGKKRARIAVARTILQSCYFMIDKKVRYQDLGAEYFERRNPEGLAKHLAKRIQKLGFTISMEKAH